MEDVSHAMNVVYFCWQLLAMAEVWAGDNEEVLAVVRRLLTELEASVQF